jgi:hypothetical protein
MVSNSRFTSSSSTQQLARESLNELIHREGLRL